MSRPIVAIVGRPNVGKSTLFNKLIGQRLSIVEDTPGVTRDRIFGECEWKNRKFSLVDTGGIEPESKDIILSQMRTQAQIAIDSADCIIFVTDVRTGMVATDLNIAQMLQRSNVPVIVCVNKCDTLGDPPADFYEFYNLGLGDPIQVSSVHGHGTGDLLDAVLEHLPEEKEEEDEGEIIKVAVIGKPNVGKSSLINRILGEKRLIVSDIAGTTRDAVDTMFENEQGRYMFIDTAGIRETADTVEKLGVERSKKAVEDADLILALLDGSAPPAPEALEPLALAARSGKPWLLLLTKSDLGGVQDVQFDEDWRAPEAVVSLSSVTHEGFGALEAAVRRLYPAPRAGSALVTNARQAEAVRRALDSVRAAKEALLGGMTPDVGLTEVEQAQPALGELTGRTAREDMVARIFERFCVGK